MKKIQIIGYWVSPKTDKLLDRVINKSERPLQIFYHIDQCQQLNSLAFLKRIHAYVKWTEENSTNLNLSILSFRLYPANCFRNRSKSTKFFVCKLIALSKFQTEAQYFMTQRRSCASQHLRQRIIIEQIDWIKIIFKGATVLRILLITSV